MNWRGFEHLDASHGLEVFCRARMFEVHVLPILNNHPSFYCLLSPQFSSPSVLFLACVSPLVSLLFSVAVVILSVGPVASWCCWSSSPARLSTICCRRRNFSLRRSCCLHVLPVLNNRPSFYCLLSPQFSSPSVLFLACVARPQPPLVTPGKSCVARLSWWRWPGQVAARHTTKWTSRRSKLGVGEGRDS